MSLLTYDDGFDGIFTFAGMLLRVTWSHSARQERGAEVDECAASRIDASDDLDRRGLKVSQDMILCNDGHG